MKSLKPNDLGNQFLVENCQKIRMQDILRSSKEKLKEALLNAEIEASGVKVELATSKTYNNGIRFWFKCPICQARIAVLYKHPINGKVGCRNCLNLEYRKRKYKGMIEAKLP
ncbi:MAG: hypothetical protein M1484_04635 [Patescibacteria group bacterium]|nr:hypothetical protein [Patescibacteria group bacterium]MCL5432343.1 hypothetical protein [Patescibacteria group bacterium]